MVTGGRRQRGMASVVVLILVGGATGLTLSRKCFGLGIIFGRRSARSAD